MSEIPRRTENTQITTKRPNCNRVVIGFLSANVRNFNLFGSTRSIVKGLGMDFLLTNRLAKKSGRLRGRPVISKDGFRLARPNFKRKRAFIAPDLGRPDAFLLRTYREAMAAGKDIVIFIHGGCSGVRGSIRRFNTVRRHLAAEHKIYATIAVAWPSNCRRYCRLVNNAHRTGKMLNTTLRPLLRHIQSIAPDERRVKVHLIAHSMGGMVVEMTLAAAGLPQGTINEVILAAPDVSANGFRPNGPLSALRTLAQRVHVYSGWSDRVVGTTGLISCKLYPSYTRMGRVGIHKQHRTPPIYEVAVDKKFGIHHSFYNSRLVRSDWSRVIGGMKIDDFPKRVQDGTRQRLGK